MSAGIEELLGATDGNVHLGFHRGYLSEVGGDVKNVLREGRVVVILATNDEVNKERLSLVDNRLFYAKSANADPKPLTGHDYMTFRIERREERGDWLLSAISEPMNKAIEAIVMGRDDEAKAFEQASIIAAFQSDDLSMFDRRRVVQAVKDELREVAGQGLGAVGGKPRDLDKVREVRGMTLNASKAKGAMSLDEALRSL